MNLPHFVWSYPHTSTRHPRQAIARAHRIGQKRPVVVYRLVAEHTVEERVVAVAAQKLKIEHLAINDVRGGSTPKLTAEDVRHVVSYGASALFAPAAADAAGTRLWDAAAVDALITQSVSEAQAETVRKLAAAAAGEDYGGGVQGVFAGLTRWKLDVADEATSRAAQAEWRACFDRWQSAVAANQEAKQEGRGFRRRVADPVLPVADPALPAVLPAGLLPVVSTVDTSGVGIRQSDSYNIEDDAAETEDAGGSDDDDDSEAEEAAAMPLPKPQPVSKPNPQAVPHKLPLPLKPSPSLPSVLPRRPVVATPAPAAVPRPAAPVSSSTAAASVTAAATSGVISTSVLAPCDMSIKDMKTELTTRGVSLLGLLEKSDLISALIRVRSAVMT